MDGMRDVYKYFSHENEGRDIFHYSTIFSLARTKNIPWWSCQYI